MITVHALKIESLGLGVDSSAAMVGFNVHFNSLGSASMTLTYL